MICASPTRTLGASARAGSALRRAVAQPTLLRGCSRVLIAVKAQAGFSSPASIATATANGVPVVVEIPAPQAPPLPGVLPPAAAYDNIVSIGVQKAGLPAWRTMLMGVLAGCFISYACIMAITVGGGLTGIATTNPSLHKLIVGLVFPFGLLMVSVCGAELYTGNTAVVTAAVYEKKATWGQLAKNWFYSYLGNFIGCMAMVALVSATGLLASSSVPAQMAAYKTSLPLMQAFTRGIMCNWLVCIAVWMASSATTLPGKVLGCWAPIAAFVTMGMEHSIANMFFIPMGMMLGAKVTVGEFIMNNLLPVTLGNTVAGVVCMATTYALCFGSLGKSKGKA